MGNAVINGYVAAAPELIPRYEAISPSDLFSNVSHLFPDGHCRTLDIGAGTGVAAAWLAARGQHVLAVEPVDAFRKAGVALHDAPNIEWLEDMLPALTKTIERREVFDVVLLSAVWHHLTSEQRQCVMPNLRTLMAPDGVLMVSLRNGPGAKGRPCYHAAPQEIIDLAISEGLHPVLCQSAESVQTGNRAAGVTWTWLVFGTMVPQKDGSRIR